MAAWRRLNGLADGAAPLGSAVIEFRRGLPGVLCRPQLLVAPHPEVDPRALVPFALIDGALQAPQVLGVPGFLGALVGLQPDTASARIDLAAAIHPDAAAR